MSEDNPVDASLSAENLSIKPDGSLKPAEITKSMFNESFVEIDNS